ncbi:MAG: hypothetical protein LBT77_00625 [Mycoplasmataceae bacterium]|nr:hypothetical protein [Mycoplasmataceae bacterium]
MSTSKKLHSIWVEEEKWKIMKKVADVTELPMSRMIREMFRLYYKKFLKYKQLDPKLTIGDL